MSSAATATSAATTAGSGAGEGAEEAAKDSADIAAFFRSGECGSVPGAREGSDVLLPELGDGVRAAGFVRWSQGRLALPSSVRGAAALPRVVARVPGGRGKESRDPSPVPGDSGLRVGPSNSRALLRAGRHPRRQKRGVKTGAAGGPAGAGAGAVVGSAPRRCCR